MCNGSLILAETHNDHGIDADTCHIMWVPKATFGSCCHDYVIIQEDDAPMEKTRTPILSLK